MPKRYRTPKAKDGQLKAQWGKLPHETPDLIYVWGDGVPRCDSRLLYNIFSMKRFPPGSFEADPSFLDELKARGYDLTTIKFSVEKLSR